MGHLPTAAKQGKLFREEWRWLSLRAIAPRDGQAGTVHLAMSWQGEKVIHNMEIPLPLASSTENFSRLP